MVVGVVEVQLLGAFLFLPAAYGLAWAVITVVPAGTALPLAYSPFSSFQSKPRIFRGVPRWAGSGITVGRFTVVLFTVFLL
ncbi:hypothetical protein BGP81_28300 [Pseudomonas putida]|nr:hypothetical protein BGP81_28300 [Pseudomonas putida]